MRKTIIAGNWKMNNTIPEAVELVKNLVPLVKDVSDVDIVVCPTYVCLSEVSKIIKDTNVKLGAQDVYWEEKGAFTGKISTSMLKSAGVEYVIIGHSEQRTYFNETNETVNKKIRATLDAGLKPIVCVGETLEEREQNKAEEVINNQIKGAFENFSAEEVGKCVVAYEPVWAIGTGKTATAEQAQEIHAFIRKLLTEMYSGELAQSVRIQYGGSMKPDNAASLLAKEDIDGGLIGGAALKADLFKGIIKPS